jgi:hypothetical protein
MYTVEDQLAALKTAAFHLREHAILAFDTFFPKFEFELLRSSIGKEIFEFEWPDPSHAGRIIRRYSRVEAYDKIALNFTVTLIFRVYDGETLLSEVTAPLRLADYTYPHLKALFLLAKLESIEEYGSFSRAPLDNDATDMIFLLRNKTKRPVSLSNNDK